MEIILALILFLGLIVSWMVLPVSLVTQPAPESPASEPTAFPRTIPGHTA